MASLARKPNPSLLMVAAPEEEEAAVAAAAAAAAAAEEEKEEAEEEEGAEEGGVELMRLLSEMLEVEAGQAVLEALEPLGGAAEGGYAAEQEGEEEAGYAAEQGGEGGHAADAARALDGWVSARRPSAAFSLVSATFWDLLSRACTSTSSESAEVQALLLCATTLLERATRVVRAAAAATPHGVTLPDSCFRASLLALLPIACAALSLFSSFASTVASRLLPPLLTLAEALPTVAEPFGAAALRQLQRQPDFDLAHPGHLREPPPLRDCVHVRAPGVDGELLEYLAALRPAMRHGRGRGQPRATR